MYAAFVRMHRPPRVDWRFATICTILLALGFGVQTWINAYPSPTITLPFALTRATVVWFGWLILLPLIIGVARRHPFGGETRARWLYAHAGYALLFIALHSLFVSIGRGLAGIPVTESLVDAFLTIFVNNFAGDVLRYGFISLSYQAVAYHTMVRERDREAVRLEVDLAEAKLANLEDRLRPHFLFNTLNSIAALIREDARAAETMVQQLSELLRASLTGDPSRDVPLSEEIHLAKQYLAIQQIRFQDRLRVSLEATDDVRGALVPQYLLQPLVENAVIHGIAPRESGGTIWMNAGRVNGRVRITVEDDGVGMGNAPPSTSGNGIGLGSVRSRLAHRFGQAQKVEIAPRHPTGTRVTIEIPYLDAAR
jgi:two-component system, LytTR family, sensor kinase